MFMNTEERVFHLGLKPSDWERQDLGIVTHFERNIAIGEEVITMSRYRGDIAGGRVL